ncbi:MAG: hypothetical protein PHQ12_02385 [Chthoniobacteraceae bacterium]|nr:hypothetical protein [Chthoniobacteraceae bacterium]
MEFFSPRFPVFRPLAVLAAALLVIPAVAAPAPDAALIPNADFQKETGEGGWPEGWGSLTPGTGKSWEVEEGKHFVRLVSQQPGQVQTLYRDIKIAAGKIKGVTVGIRYRTSGVKPGDTPADSARALILFKDNSGRILDSSTIPFSGSAAGWTEAAGQMLVPASATHLIVIAGLVRAAAGTVDLGAITAAPLGDAEAEKLAAAQAVAAQAVATPSPESWVANGDFETPNANGDWPAHWGNPAPGMSWEAEEGKHFLRIVSQKPGDNLMVYRAVPLKKGVKGVELSIRSRSTGVQHGDNEWFDARTMVRFLGADGQPVQAEGGNLDVVFTHNPAPTGWMTQTRLYAVPADATQLQLLAGLFRAAAGTVDLAEIRVTPASDEAVERMKLCDAAYGAWKGDDNARMERRIDQQIDAQLAATGNLVFNGSFELATRTPSWPDGWGNGTAPGVSWETDAGRHFMRLVSPSPEKTLMLYRMVVLKTGLKAIDVTLRYRLTNFAKGDRMPGDARVAFHFFSGGRFGHLEYGKQLAPDPSPIVFSSKAAEWTEIRRRYPVPEGATKLQMMPGLWNVQSGTLDLAEIRVAPATDSPAAGASETPGAR